VNPSTEMRATVDERKPPPGPPAPSAAREETAREAVEAPRRAPAGPGPTGTGEPPRRRRWDPSLCVGFAVHTLLFCVLRSSAVRSAGARVI
jgi:hypothetical protein